MRYARAAFLLVLLPLACSPSEPTKLGTLPDSASNADAGSEPADSIPAQPDASDDLSDPLAVMSWPGDNTIAIASGKSAFGANVSGLAYQPASASASAVLWAVQNEPSKLYRLTWDGSTFAPITGDGWTTGKLMRYPGGTGSPDTEGMTRTEWTSPEAYVVAERDNDAKDISRQSILRYDLSGTRGIMDATHEWILTADLLAAGLNEGLEGITWIPDSYLVARGFYDENKLGPYDPAAYPEHGTGIFVVGFDATGMIYGYVLDLVAGAFSRLATFTSGQERSVDITFDRDTGTLWSLCDDACKGRMTVFDIDGDATSATYGRFVRRATVQPPKALAGMNNEGITLAPESECSGARKAFFWTDDLETSGYSIRKGAITCGRIF